MPEKLPPERFKAMKEELDECRIALGLAMQYLSSVSKYVEQVSHQLNRIEARNAPPDTEGPQA